MSIKPGLYLIESVTYEGSFVGTGPIPPTHPLPPVPLRTIQYGPKDIFNVNPLKIDRYSITLLRHSTTVVHDQDDVMTGHLAGKPALWAIERANDNGHFLIKLPYVDKCWTAGYGEDGNPIRLQGANGDRVQQWRFVPIQEDY